MIASSTNNQNNNTSHVPSNCYAKQSRISDQPAKITRTIRCGPSFETSSPSSPSKFQLYSALCYFEMVNIKDPHADSGTRCPTGSCTDCLALEPIRIKLVKAIEEAQKLASTFCNQLKNVNEVHSDIIETLPVEITSRIFEHCIIMDDSNVKCNRFKLREKRQKEYLPLPMKLGSICRTWRQISRSTPSLWKDLVLNLKAYTPPEHTTLVQEWIERGKSTGLRVYLYSYMDCTTMDPSLLTTITLSSDHWEEVTFFLPHVLILDIMRSIFNLINLRSLSVKDGYNLETRPILMEDAHASPERITLSGLNPYCANINWKNVTYASIHNTYGYACIDMLRVATNLESCWFTDLFDGEPPSPLTMVVNAKLQHFKYAEEDRGRLKFLSWLSFPNLQNFCVTSMGRFKNKLFLKNFANFISRSPSASTLLYRFRDQPYVLRLARTFSRLQINGKVTSELLKALSRAGTPFNSNEPMGEIILPSIREIHITLSANESRGSHFKWHELVALFDSPSSWFRIQNVSFKINADRKWDDPDVKPEPPILEQLIGLRRGGVEIECTIALDEPCPYETRDLFVIWEKGYQNINAAT